MKLVRAVKVGTMKAKFGWFFDPLRSSQRDTETN
jgi:hypothetical protein